MNILSKKISLISLPCLVVVYSIMPSDYAVSKDCMILNNELKSIWKSEVGLLP